MKLGNIGAGHISDLEAAKGREDETAKVAPVVTARTIDGLNATILADATTAARRAGWCARNNPWATSAVDSLVGNVVGASIKP